MTVVTDVCVGVGNTDADWSSFVKHSVLYCFSNTTEEGELHCREGRLNEFDGNPALEISLYDVYHLCLVRLPKVVQTERCHWFCLRTLASQTFPHSSAWRLQYVRAGRWKDLRMGLVPGSIHNMRCSTIGKSSGYNNVWTTKEPQLLGRPRVCISSHTVQNTLPGRTA